MRQIPRPLEDDLRREASGPDGTHRMVWLRDQWLEISRKNAAQITKIEGALNHLRAVRTTADDVVRDIEDILREVYG